MRLELGIISSLHIFQCVIKHNAVWCVAKGVGGRNLWSAHRIASLKGVQIRTVASGCMACHSVIISTEGKVYSWGTGLRLFLL